MVRGLNLFLYTCRLRACVGTTFAQGGGGPLDGASYRLLGWKLADIGGLRQLGCCRDPSGDAWRCFRNFYIQSLSARLAFHDVAMIDYYLVGSGKAVH